MSQVVERGKDEEEGEAMDTPERSKIGQIGGSVSKVEESPVFSFLNSLSPIELVKPMQISQTINPLNCTSPPLVFASPHISSLRESRLLRRSHLLDPSKPEFSSIDGDKNPADETNISDSDKFLNDGNCNPRAGNSEVRRGEPPPSHGSAKFMAESAQNLSHKCNNSSSGLDHSSGLKSDHTSTHSHDYMLLVPLAEEPVQGASYVREANVGGAAYHIDQDIEAPACDWESLINASDLLIFESPDVTADALRKSIDRGPSLYTSMDEDMHHMATEFGQSDESDNLCTQPSEGNEMAECTENKDVAADPSMKGNDAGERIDYEHLPGFYHGIRRRCLVFEMAGARMKHLDNTESTSSVLPQSDCNISMNEEKQLVLTKKGNDSSNRGLPGIGLHLNAIAKTPKGYKIINQDSSASGRLLIGQSSRSANLQTTSPGQELTTMDDIVLADSSERNTVNEEVNPSSPKKKRRREQDTAVEAQACKRCNCKKSKCLKLYCECFAAGVYCVEPCACIDCFNKPIHEDTVLATRKQIESRNPLAFAPKVIRDSDPMSETGVDSTKTPASARHKRGCNCKKSGCLKKYCECYQSGVGCSINCRCEGCKNAFGRKDGSGVIVMELEVEEDEETDSKNEKAIADIASALPSTPSRASRLYANKGCEKTSSYFDTIREEDEIPDFLQENSPIDGVKTSSPNGKRVSPPRSAMTQSPSQGLRSSRKLILRSIPSFPSLNTNQ